MSVGYGTAKSAGAETNRISLSDAVIQNWGLLAFIAVVPLQNLYIQKFSGLGAGLNILNGCVLLSLFILVVRQKNVAVRGITSPVGGWVIAWVLCMVLALVIGSMKLSGLPADHVGLLKDQLTPILMFYVATRAIRCKKQMHYLLLAASLPLPYMFRSFYVQYQTVASWHYSDNLRLVNGTFSELGSNEFAAYFATYTLVALGIYLHSANRRLRIYLLVLMAMAGYAFIYSHSRGAWLSGIGGLIAMGSITNWRKTLVVAVTCVALSAPLMHFLPVSVQERYSTIFVGEGERDNSAESRFVLWDEAMKQFSSSPVVGIGFHTFQHLNVYGKDTHNFFVKTLTEEGVVGIFIISILLILSALQCYKLARAARDELARGFGAGMFGCVVAMLIGNMFGDRFTHYPLISNFWIFLGVVLVLNKGLVSDLESSADGSRNAVNNDTKRPARKILGGAIRSRTSHPYPGQAAN